MYLTAIGSWRLFSVAALLAIALLIPATGNTASVTTLYSFAGGTGDGYRPTARLIIGATGTLYGTTENGGTSNDGTVYSLTPPAPIKLPFTARRTPLPPCRILRTCWTENVLYSFGSYPTDGVYPYAGLLAQPGGRLYGTTLFGGSNGWWGTVFQLLQVSGGSWSEGAAHAFPAFAGDGEYPISGLVADGGGNLYGVTNFGGVYSNAACGTSGCGTVFRLGSNGAYSVLHNFGGSTSDGYWPSGDLAINAKGALFGATTAGGSTACASLAGPGSVGCGTVFELGAPRLILSKGRQIRTYSVLHSFNGADGSVPSGGVTLDTAGAVYGATDMGGSGKTCGSTGCGTVFKLSPQGTAWTLTMLHSFNGSDGEAPNGPPIFGMTGALFGTTNAGGGTGGMGTVYQLTPSATAPQWTLTDLHIFTGVNSDGAGPIASLLAAPGGTVLYGTTSTGGVTNNGTVFEVTP